MMAENRKLTIGEMAANLNIAYESVQDILYNDLGFGRVAAKLVPKDMISTAEFDWFGSLRLLPFQSTQKIAPGNAF